MKYDEVKVIKKEMRTDSHFDGKLIEYIGYNLLAFIITIITLTIAKPWADKLVIEYKVNHTIYNGKRLKFEGKGSSLFVQRFKWILLSIITIGIYCLWIPIKKQQWITSNIHFSDEDFIEGESYFDGKLIQMIGVNLFSKLLTLISLGLLLPYTLCYKEKWIAKHTVINCKKMKFDGKAISLIGHYLLWWFLTILTLGIFLLWLPLKIYGWKVKNTHIKLKEEIEEKTSIIPMIIGLLLVILVISSLVIFIPKTNIIEVIAGDEPIEEIFNFDKKDKENNSNNKQGETTKPIIRNNYEVKIDSDGGNINSNMTYKVGDIINDLKSPTKSGYTFIRWEDENGNEIKNGYVITKSIQIKAVWKKNVQKNTNTNPQNTEPKKVSKCDDGYVYVEIDNKCYSKTEHASPVAEHTYDDNGEIIASGIKCPDGYMITWDIEPAGECFKYKNPNY